MSSPSIYLITVFPQSSSFYYPAINFLATVETFTFQPHLLFPSSLPVAATSNLLGMFSYLVILIRKCYRPKPKVFQYRSRKSHLHQHCNYHHHERPKSSKKITLSHTKAPFSDRKREKIHYLAWKASSRLVRLTMPFHWIIIFGPNHP